MHSVNIDSRLLAAAGFVRTDSRVICDVGTDHALLPCYLRGITDAVIIASDINEGPLSAAESTMKQYGVSDIVLKKSDGLDEIDYADDVIVAGMGGELISDIISRCRFVHIGLRLILQPMTKHAALRKYLYSAGFSIVEEKAASDSARIYTVICAEYTGEKQEIADWFACVGKNRNEKYISAQLNKLKKMSLGNPALKDVTEKIKEETGYGNGTGDI